jgi:hypothetical protein
MNEDQLEDFIYKAKRSVVPDCPGSVEQNVLRRIRLSGSSSGRSGLDFLFRILPQPSFIAAGLAIVTVVSFGVTVLSNGFGTTGQDSQLLAASALDFNVFQQTELLHFDDH